MYLSLLYAGALLWKCQFRRAHITDGNTAPTLSFHFCPESQVGREKASSGKKVHACKYRSVDIKSETAIARNQNKSGSQIGDTTHPAAAGAATAQSERPSAQRQILKAQRPPIAWVSFCVRFGRLHLSSFIWKRRAGVLLKPSQNHRPPSRQCVCAAFVHLYATAFFLLCVRVYICVCLLGKRQYQRDVFWQISFWGIRPAGLINLPESYSPWINARKKNGKFIYTDCRHKIWWCMWASVASSIYMRSVINFPPYFALLLAHKGGGRI